MATSGGKEQAERTIFHLLLQQITVVLGVPKNDDFIKKIIRAKMVI